MTRNFVTPLNRRSRRRSGSVLVYMALGLFAFLGAASLAVDMGDLYSRKAKAQQAADAAALGAVYKLATFQADAGNSGPAVTAAHDYARANGYDDANPSVVVNTFYPIAGEPNRFRVQVQRREPLFFARIFFQATKPVAASATAEYTTFAELNTTGGGVYGQPDGPTSLSMFGPDGFYNNGDYRSVRLLADRRTPNPDYHDPADPDPLKASKAGYDFRFVIPFSYTSTTIEVFDPDSHNAGDLPNAGRDSAGNLLRVDELRKPDGSGGTAADATVTRYTLYWDAGDSNPLNDVKIDSVEVGDDASTDMKWNSMFTFNRANYPTGQFRLNAVTVAGSSENGFNLRARPTGDVFKPDNGTSVTASGYIPMNFNSGGNSTVTLGTVPQEAAGKPLTIKKFDTDVGGQSVVYSYETADHTVVTWPTPGVLAGNGNFTTDTITLPLDYPGGTWKATYTAGNQDTSVWEMNYAAYTPGRPGPIRLVR